jgi:hypothetical protein
MKKPHTGGTRIKVRCGAGSSLGNGVVARIFTGRWLLRLQARASTRARRSNAEETLIPV